MITEKVKFESVDQYIQAFPKEIQDILSTVRETVRKAVPEAEEVISYNIPAYKYPGWIVYFSAYTNHYSLSCPPPFTVFEIFKQELSPYKVSKSAIQFPFNKPIPVQLISDIAKFRAQESLEIANKKKKKK